MREKVKVDRKHALRNALLNRSYNYSESFVKKLQYIAMVLLAEIVVFVSFFESTASADATVTLLLLYVLYMLYVIAVQSFMLLVRGMYELKELSRPMYHLMWVAAPSAFLFFILFGIDPTFTTLPNFLLIALLSGWLQSFLMFMQNNHTETKAIFSALRVKFLYTIILTMVGVLSIALLNITNFVPWFLTTLFAAKISVELFFWYLLYIQDDKWKRTSHLKIFQRTVWILFFLVFALVVAYTNYGLIV